MNKDIGLSEATLGLAEQTAVLEVVKSGWLTQGDTVKKFEESFASQHGFKYSCAVSSCTAGLHMALVAAGVKAGDEVLIPSLSFVAAANTVVQCGAVPVFMDIASLRSPHVSLAQANDKVTEKTRAVMIVDYAGYLVKTQPWRDFADQHGISLIDDTAHAAGAAQHSNLADFCTYSFFGNKNMTTAEGGMVCTNDEQQQEILQRIRSHGMTTSTLDRKRGHAYSYDVERLGFNYRMDELRAAMGLVQLQHVSGWNATRRELSQRYRELIDESQLPLMVPFELDESAACHLQPVVLPESSNRQLIMQYMREQGIQTSIHYPPIHQFSFYKRSYPAANLSTTESYCERELTLPLHPGITKADVSTVIRNLDDALKQST